ncbi:alpha/beta-hydrolase [Dendrothele bispora CBS 962.96]|uniref:Alpha/beta-hydrolase n=1 Tax=Dendrothele bispora (strain CBS 962.96) TaxID=1314807 RepID=A0A4S8LGS6_DENBC|nr:alpha/beta-hydrolase [Dendrothele bispora CBS 962.96]
MPSWQTDKKCAPYGTWESPITAELIAGSVTSVSETIVDPTTSIVYHIEGRPSEQGRSVLVESQAARDVVGPGWNVRTGVYDYGGAPATVYAGLAYFSNFTDNRVYVVDAQQSGSTPEPVTPATCTRICFDKKENTAHRFAQIRVHPEQNNILVALFEDHTVDTPSSVVNTLCLINTVTKNVTNLVSGSDFYAFPLFSPKGDQLVWQQWSNPHMPWESSQILIADVTLTGSDPALELSNITTIAGGDGNSNISVGWMSWASNETLLFLSDESGFINPWKYDVSSKQSSAIFPEPVEQDFASVMWYLSMFPYAVVDPQYGIFSAWKDGRSILYLVNLENGTSVELENPYVNVDSMRTVSLEKNQVVFVGGKVNDFSGVIQCTVTLGDSPQVNFEILDPPEKVPFPQDLVSIPKGMTLEVPPNGDPLYVVFYAPFSLEYEGPPGEKPPCVLNVHGGPTGMAYQNLQSIVQYYTSRGWVWLDVNYSGSFGYGRAYRDKLNGKWGPLDSEDCITAAGILASAQYNYIDPDRTVIRGSSSGGLTVLTSVSLSSNLNAFAAATSLYGVADLVSLMKETHKFEAHYMLPPGTPEEQQKILYERSPINYANRIKKPVLFLQGDIDDVVPKEQALSMYNSIIKAGGKAELKLYAGEGHGFVRKDTQEDALKRELDFYERYLKLKE